MFVNSEPDAEKIRQPIDAILHTARLPSDAESNLGKRSSHFSDTAVRTSPLRSKSGEPYRYGIVFHEVLSVVFVQLFLFSRCSRFVRGVITIGDIFHDEDILFGPGLIRAYDFERKRAKLPAIVVDEALIQRYRTDQLLWELDNDFRADAEYVSDLLCYDVKAGLWFVDYLRACESELEEGEYPEVLGLHRDSIAHVYEAANSDLGIILKADWLTDYHNFTLRERQAQSWLGGIDLFLPVTPNRVESNFLRTSL
jgi:hypothetical protein